MRKENLWWLYQESKPTLIREEESTVDKVEVQLLIMFYKEELKAKPYCLATRALLERNRDKLKRSKYEV